MRVSEIEKLFADEKTLDLVLEDIAKDMDKIDKWLNISVSDMNDNPEEIKKAIDELSQAYGNIRIVLGIAETEYKNRDVKYYEQKKIECEAEGKKFVSGATEKEASLRVAEYRRIRNIVQAYEQSCSKRIVVLQSILKDINKEYNQSQE